MENPYAKSAFQVTLCDPAAGPGPRPVRTWMFLGAIPRNVLDAARAGGPAGWPAPAAATLRTYYGPGWRRLLTPASLDSAAVVGGAEDSLDFGDLDDFDAGPDAAWASRPSDLSSEPRTPSAAAAPPLLAEERGRVRASARPTYIAQSVYPEDTFADLKLKIYAATEIPPYCQHLYWGAGGAASDTRTSYEIRLEGGRVAVDVRMLGEAPAAGRVAGLPVDRALETGRDGLRVVALDAFLTLGAADGGGPLRRVFVADFRDAFWGAGAGRAPEALTTALADAYEADLLYYGLALRFWPALSPDAFRLAALRGAEAVGEVYPALAPALAGVRARLAGEQDLLEKTYMRAARALGLPGAARVAVTEATVGVAPPDPRTRIDVRNVFDCLPTSPHVPGAIARVSPTPGAGVVLQRRDYRAEKRHVASAVPAAAAALAPFFARRLPRPGVAFAVRRPPGAGSPSARAFANAPPRYDIVTFYADGRYSAQGAWREDDRADLSDVLAQLGGAARPLVDAVNGLGAAALPHGRGLEVLPRAGISKADPECTACGSGIGSADGGCGAEISSADGGCGGGARNSKADPDGNQNSDFEQPLRTEIGELTASAYWPRAMTDGEFREAKGLWRAYEAAGIVSILGLQQAGAYSFYFRKGIVAYSAREIERAGSASGPPDLRTPGLANGYAHLTDLAAEARWLKQFGGRLVRVYHRTADLRIEVVGASAAEFERVRRYMFAFLDGLRGRGSGSDRHARPDPRHGVEKRGDGRRLRALQENDPDLFHPEKFDRTATVYSVLCQGDRQPAVYTEAEARALSAAARGRLTRYWNFTERRPAYYGCPSQAYPALHFQAGRHPLGYCLPCCKKAEAVPGSRGALVNAQCGALAGVGPGAEVEAAGAVAEPADAAGSRHVLAYGKAVPPGRVSLPPAVVADELCFGALPEPLGLYLLGVDQSTPAIPDAGHFYALAAAVESTPAEFGAELAFTARALGPTYYSVAMGAAAAFSDAGALADAIVRAFVDGDPGFGPFVPGGVAAETWRPIIDELVSLRYGIDVVVFRDGGEAGVVLEAAPAAAARMRGSGPVDLALVSAGPGGTYPIAAADLREFLRTPGGRGPARRTFASEAWPGGSPEGPPDRIAETIRAAAAGPAHPAERAPPGLAFLLEFARAAGFRPEAKLVNLRDMCYGLYVRDAAGAAVYLPLPYEAHYLAESGADAPSDPQKGIPSRYGPRPADPLPRDALRACVDALNRHITRRSAGQARKGAGVLPVTPAAVLVRDGMAVGFIAEAATGGATAGGAAGSGAATGGLFYYHDPAPLGGWPDPDGRAAGPPLPRAAAPYDTREVDEEIYRAGGRPALSPHPDAATAELAAAALHVNHLYRLFVAEFAERLRTERDDARRNELKRLAGAGLGRGGAAAAEFWKAAAALLVGHPADFRALRAIETAARTAGGDVRRAFVRGVDAASFDFDRTTLDALRALPGRAAVRAALDPLMRDLVDLEPRLESPGPELANVYVACGAQTSLGRPHCTGIKPRLAVPPGRYPELLDILAADILNPLRATALAARASGVIDDALFIARPGETVRVFPPDADA